MLYFVSITFLQGKDLYMDLDTDSLRLIDPQDLAVLNYQPIHTIRVWGVGRENGRYAYFLTLTNNVAYILQNLSVFSQKPDFKVVLRSYDK